MPSYVNMDLTRKNGASTLVIYSMGTGVAFFKTTGLTYCHVECKRTGL